MQKNYYFAKMNALKNIFPKFEIEAVNSEYGFGATI